MIKIIERNDHCPCGSGQKYKKCCLLKSISKQNASLNKLTFQNEENNKYICLKNNNDLIKMIELGYNLLEKKNNNLIAAHWSDTWKVFKIKIKTEYPTLKKIDNIILSTYFLINWIQDFENFLLSNAPTLKELYGYLIKFADDFCDLFPESNETVILSLKRAAAEGKFALGNYLEGEKRFEEIITKYPNNEWGYIGWGDMYYLFSNISTVKPDYERAKSIYKKALENPDLNDTKEVIARLKDLDYEYNSKGK